MLVPSLSSLLSEPKDATCNGRAGAKAYAWDHEINILANIKVEDVAQTRISNKHNSVCINTPEVFDGQSCKHSSKVLLPNPIRNRTVHKLVRRPTS